MTDTRFTVNGYDIRKYFDSISHSVLKKQLYRRFKDVVVLRHFSNIIDSYQHTDCRGVPIGSLTSQFFANHYLAVLDHFIKEKLKARCYVRYMNDFVIWEKSAENLKAIYSSVEEFLHSELELTLKPEVLNRTRNGVTFLGFRIFPDRVCLAHRSRYRFRRKIRTMHDLFESGEWNEEEYSRHLNALFAFIHHGKSHAFRDRVMREIGIHPQELQPCESRR